MEHLEDKTCPTGPWEFDEEVAACFDAMLQASIPSYDRMRELCFVLGQKFVRPFTGIVDIGASLGRATEPFISKFHGDNRYHLYEKSEAMQRRLLEHPLVLDNPNVYVHDDILEYRIIGSGLSSNSLILSILTMQFIPVEYRTYLMGRLYASLTKGGALIVVEKVTNSDPLINKTFVDTYHEMKGTNGYTQEQIEAKRRSLSGVLVPLAVSWNEDLMRGAGFSHVEMFYRDLNFVGWLAVKD